MPDMLTMPGMLTVAGWRRRLWAAAATRRMPQRAIGEATSRLWSLATVLTVITAARRRPPHIVATPPFAGPSSCVATPRSDAAAETSPSEDAGAGL
jgi:hypothetical protein